MKNKRFRIEQVENGFIVYEDPDHGLCASATHVFNDFEEMSVWMGEQFGVYGPFEDEPVQIGYDLASLKDTPMVTTIQNGEVVDIEPFHPGRIELAKDFPRHGDQRILLDGSGKTEIFDRYLKRWLPEGTELSTGPAAKALADDIDAEVSREIRGLHHDGIWYDECARIEAQLEAAAPPDDVVSDITEMVVKRFST